MEVTRIRLHCGDLPWSHGAPYKLMWYAISCGGVGSIAELELDIIISIPIFTLSSKALTRKRKILIHVFLLTLI